VWRHVLMAVTTAIAVVAVAAGASASVPDADARLSNDCLNLAGDPLADPSAPLPACAGGGYVSAYTLATGIPYTDPVLSGCSVSRGRQNEPAVGVDPRDTRVLVGSSNDYCGVFATSATVLGPVWLGYYRSEDSGTSFRSSLVPGYPGDTSPFAALSQARTNDSGDPVIAWDTHGRLFMGSESSGDPAGTFKQLGDVWVARYENPAGPAGATMNDGKRYAGTTVVARGSATSAPRLTGKFHDKTAIEVDRTGGACDGNVYFSWSRFTGSPAVGFNSAVYFARSTDHGVTFSSPIKLSTTVHDIQFPDISVTGNGHVYITFRRFQSQVAQIESDAVMVVKSTDCGRTFSAPHLIATFEPYDPADIADPEPIPAPPANPEGGESPEAESDAAQGERVGTCGDFAAHCASGYTFFRGGTQVRSTADQLDPAHEWIYILYDPSKPGTEVPTGTTFGTTVSIDLPVKYHQSVGSQAGVHFIRYDGATGAIDIGPTLVDNEPTGHQIFPDISADGGVLHALWWDSRNDSCYSAARPIGNCADRKTVPALDVFATMSTDRGATWHGVAPATVSTRVTDVTSNPNYEQFGGRASPFAGDYLYVTSMREFAFGVWTDWRDTVRGIDPREQPEDEDGGTADVKQCRVPQTVQVSKKETATVWSADLCPHAGGLDQNVYGDTTP
jgi:hypothetical protein